MTRDAATAHPCPAGDECALNKGAAHCFHCRRNWPRDETWDMPFEQRPNRERAAATVCGHGYARGRCSWPHCPNAIDAPWTYPSPAARGLRCWHSGGLHIIRRRAYRAFGATRRGGWKVRWRTLKGGSLMRPADSETVRSAATASLRDLAEFAIGALRSNQDVLLHKVARTEVVREQLSVNLAAIRHLQEAISDAE